MTRLHLMSVVVKLKGCENSPDVRMKPYLSRLKDHRKPDALMKELEDISEDELLLEYTKSKWPGHNNIVFKYKENFTDLTYNNDYVNTRCLHKFDSLKSWPVLRLRRRAAGLHNRDYTFGSSGLKYYEPPIFMSLSVGEEIIEEYATQSSQQSPDRWFVTDTLIEALEALLDNETIDTSSYDFLRVMDMIDYMLYEEMVDDIPGEILQNLDQLTLRLELDEAITGEGVWDNIAVLMADVSPENLVRGVRIAASRDGSLFTDEFEFINDTSTLNLLTNETDAIVLLPKSIASHPRRIGFVAFRNDRAFRNDYSCKLNSRVVSVTVEDFAGFNDGEMVEIYLNPIRRNLARNESRACAYWHFDINGTGHWSQDGCELTISKEGQLDVCRCNHLTHFAQIIISKTVFSVINEIALEILSVIGCCLSIFGVMMIALTATLFKPWRANDSNKVWLHLCSPVLLLSVCFLLTVYVQFDQADITCVVLGIALHYSVLASSCWMLVVAILSYRKIVLVFTTDIRNKMLISSVYSWGFPLLVIAILLAVDSRSYSVRYEEMAPNGKFCYPQHTAFWVTVFAPIAIMWFVNCYLYAIIVTSLKGPRNLRKHSNTKDDTLRTASVCCLLAFICGIPWVFGLLATNIIAAYLFTLTATFQGFVMFLFFIVGNNKTRDLWMKLLRLRSSATYRVTYTGVENRTRDTAVMRELNHDELSSIPLTDSTS